MPPSPEPQLVTDTLLSTATSFEKKLSDAEIAATHKIFQLLYEPELKNNVTEALQPLSGGSFRPGSEKVRVETIVKAYKKFVTGIDELSKNTDIIKLLEDCKCFKKYLSEFRKENDFFKFSITYFKLKEILDGKVFSELEYQIDYLRKLKNSYLALSATGGNYYVSAPKGKEEWLGSLYDSILEISVSDFKLTPKGQEERRELFKKLTNRVSLSDACFNNCSNNALIDRKNLPFKEIDCFTDLCEFTVEITKYIKGEFNYLSNRVNYPVVYLNKGPHSLYDVSLEEFYQQQVALLKQLTDYYNSPSCVVNQKTYENFDGLFRHSCINPTQVRLLPLLQLSLDVKKTRESQKNFLDGTNNLMKSIHHDRLNYFHGGNCKLLMSDSESLVENHLELHNKYDLLVKAIDDILVKVNKSHEGNIQEAKSLSGSIKKISQELLNFFNEFKKGHEMQFDFIGYREKLEECFRKLEIYLGIFNSELSEMAKYLEKNCRERGSSIDFNAKYKEIKELVDTISDQKDQVSRRDVEAGVWMRSHVKEITSQHQGLGVGDLFDKTQTNAALQFLVKDYGAHSKSIRDDCYKKFEDSRILVKEKLSNITPLIGQLNGLATRNHLPDHDNNWLQLIVQRERLSRQLAANEALLSLADSGNIEAIIHEGLVPLETADEQIIKAQHELIRNNALYQAIIDNNWLLNIEAKIEHYQALNDCSNKPDRNKLERQLNAILFVGVIKKFPSMFESIYQEKKQRYYHRKLLNPVLQSYVPFETLSCAAGGAEGKISAINDAIEENTPPEAYKTLLKKIGISLSEDQLAAVLAVNTELRKAQQITVLRKVIEPPAASVSTAVSVFPDKRVLLPTLGQSTVSQIGSRVVSSMGS